MAPALLRTLRLKPEEAARIDAFLARNPFFDFSSLARIAIEQFIRNPRLDVVSVDSEPKPAVKRAGAQVRRRGSKSEEKSRNELIR